MIKNMKRGVVLALVIDVDNVVVSVVLLEDGIDVAFVEEFFCVVE